MSRAVRIWVLGVLGVLWTVGISLAADQPVTDKSLILESSKLKGVEVVNHNDRNMKLGTIDNLLISAHTGQVLYGIVGMGALDRIGISSRTVAIPWKALHVAKHDNTIVLLLNKTKDDLANAPVFDVNNRPDLSKPDWSQSVDNFFGVQTPIDHAGVSGVSINQLVFLSDKLTDMDVYNRQDTNVKLGQVDDLLIKTDTGEVLFAALDTGIGGKLILVPYIAFHLQKAVDADQFWLTLNKAKDDLNNAPNVDKGQIASVAGDAKMQQDLANFFGVRTVARPKQ